MFKDIKVFLDNKLVDYKYKIINSKIIISFNVNKNALLNIVYDENIYDINDFNEINKGKLEKELNNVNNYNFLVQINYKYFIKSVYKYYNDFINTDQFIEELIIFKKCIKKYSKEIDNLINEINKYNLEDELLNNKVLEIVINSKFFNELDDKMTSLDLMLLITNYILSKRPLKVSQIEFDNMVLSAINYDHSKENIWRLAMNFDNLGYNYDLIDKFFVDSKDVWYLIEYISGVYQVDKNKIINMIKKTNDKKFIKEFVKSDFIKTEFKDLISDLT